MNWSYTFGERTSLGLSVNSRDPDYDQRNVSVFGRYWFAPDWAVSAESLSREPTGPAPAGHPHRRPAPVLNSFAG